MTITVYDCMLVVFLTREAIAVLYFSSSSSLVSCPLDAPRFLNRVTGTRPGYYTPACSLPDCYTRVRLQDCYTLALPQDC